MRFSTTDVSAALQRLDELLDARVDPELQEAFESGREIQLLSYDKVQPSSRSLPVLERYIIAASSFVRHERRPVPYYDIFRAGRASIMVQLLAGSLSHLKAAGTPNLEARLARLKVETSYDAFDAGLFELIAAWRYSTQVPGAYIEFIPETPKQKTPDFVYHFLGKPVPCECKKIDRSDTHTITIRNTVAGLLRPILEQLHRDDVSICAEIDFRAEPGLISSRSIFESLVAALDGGTPIIERDFTISARPLPPYEPDTVKLYPSPDFFWSRYRYRVRSEWMGICHLLEGGHFIQPDFSPLSKDVPVSTWLYDLRWDSAIKWRVSDTDLLAKYRRFAFNGIFKGLTQVNQNVNSSVHVWLESDYYLGGREEAMKDLYRRLEAKAQDFFGWLILNELLFDVSPKGTFDLIEHAHPIGGPLAFSATPPVTNLFMEGDMDYGMGEFGRGVSLPDIDEV